MTTRTFSDPQDVPLDSLKPHPDNPRQGDVGALTTSLERFGLYQPIVVQRSSGYIVAGNHRYLAAKQLGYATIPVVYLDVDDDTARAILVADNRLSDLATYDDDALANILRDLAEHDLLTGTGYDGDDVDSLLRSLEGVPPEGDHSGDLPGALAVIIDVQDEETQRALIDELTNRGYEVRAAVV